ncbi:MAG: metal ABC transporter permease [Bacteroidales bacterium]|nr:metal ABC transporter permease [Bacteroidales bacterium]
MLDIFSYSFFQHALIGIILVSIASAIIGTYVVCRRMVFVTGGITHASFGGLGLGFYAGLSPVVTAGIFAIASALGVEWLSERQRVREDSAIGVVWALGMALGTIFIFLTPGYVPELSSFLFGNILTISHTDLIAFGVYLAVLLSVMALFFPAIRSCAFDPNFARTQGLPVRAINLMMTVLTSVCIVLTIRLIGIMLLMSLFTMPQMIAELRTSRLLPLMGWAVAISLACSMGGVLLSIVLSVPVSSTIVLLLIILYVLARIGVRLSALCNKKRKSSL